MGDRTYEIKITLRENHSMLIEACNNGLSHIEKIGAITCHINSLLKECADDEEPKEVHNE